MNTEICQLGFINMDDTDVSNKSCFGGIVKTKHIRAGSGVNGI
jgi:hypothetical protein